MEMCVTRKTGSPPLYLAISEWKKTPAAEQDERLRNVIATLERCQADLSDPSDDETSRLFAILLLQLQTRLHRIDAAELGDLCTALEAKGRSASGKPLRERKS